MKRKTVTPACGNGRGAGGRKRQKNAAPKMRSQTRLRKQESGGTRLVWRARPGRRGETKPEKVKRLVVAACYDYLDWGTPPTEPKQIEKFLDRSIRDLLGGDGPESALRPVAESVVTYTNRYIRREFQPPADLKLPDADWLLERLDKSRRDYAEEISRRLPGARRRGPS